MCGHWGVFLQLPNYWRGHCVRIRPQRALGNVSLLSLWVLVTGSCCPPGARLGICGLALALGEPGGFVRGHRIPARCCLSLALTGHQPLVCWLASGMVISIHSPFLFIVVLGIEPRASCILDSTYVLSPHVADVSRGPGTRGLEHAKCSGKELNQVWQVTPEV